MEKPSTHLKVSRSDSVSVVEFADRKILDELDIYEIGEELNHIIDSEPGIKLLLDFRNVDHMTSSALGMLITVRNKVQEHSGKLRLANINRQIFEVFKITRLNKVFEIFDNTEEALVGF